MAGVSIPVRPGGVATQLTGSPAKGSVFYNTDTVAGIWVSTAQNVTPGRGQFIGPLGSGTWNSDALAYACVDTGVLSTVIISVSPDVTDVSNPLLLAEATAAQIAASGLAANVGIQVASQLLAGGIPNVYVNEQLDTFNPMAPNETMTEVIAGFASIIVVLSGAGVTSSCVVQYQMEQENPWVANDISIDEALTNIDGLNVDATWIIPVTGASIQFVNKSAGNIALSVYGTNRPVPFAMQLSNTYLPRKFLYVGAATAGVTTALPVNDGNPLTSTTFNRMVFARCGVGAIGGSIGYQYLDMAGVIRTNFVALNIAANSSSMISFAHPQCVCRWIGQPITTGSTSFTLDLTPEAT